VAANRKIVDAKQRIFLNNYSPALYHFGVIEVISAETEDDGVAQHRNTKCEKDRQNVNDDYLPQSFTEGPERTQKEGRPIPLPLVLFAGALDLFEFASIILWKICWDCTCVWYRLNLRGFGPARTANLICALQRSSARIAIHCRHLRSRTIAIDLRFANRGLYY